MFHYDDSIVDLDAEMADGAIDLGAALHPKAKSRDRVVRFLGRDDEIA